MSARTASAEASRLDPRFRIVIPANAGIQPLIYIKIT
jgi:hypothetical protein